jgi:hypothetical protein
MSLKASHKHPFSRKGTSQSERFPIALGKDYVNIDERSFNDLITQTAEFGTYLNFFEHDSTNAQGNWSTFFNEIYDKNTKTVKEEKINKFKENSNLAPHLGLFLAFLKLFKLSIDQLNGLTDKHLIYFYESMLRLKKRIPIPPKVSLIAEIAKDQDYLFLPKGTVFKAGKNILGEERLFATDQDFIINKAKVVELKTINLLKKNISQRNIANSADGQGAELVEDPKSWSAFGAEQDKISEIGFCISSPFFSLTNGMSELLISSSSFNGSDFDIYLSSEKGWVKLIPTKSEDWYSIDMSFLNLIPANNKIHGIDIDSKYPLIKFVIKDGEGARYFSNKYSSPQFEIKIECRDIRNLSVRNNLGKLDTSKPFEPFGSTPVADYSEIIIGHPLLFNKYVTNIIHTDENASDYSGIISYLTNGIWQPDRPSTFDSNFDKEFDVNTKNNYVKLKYDGDDSSISQASIVIEQTDTNNIKKITVTPPKFNFPIWKKLSLDSTVEFTNEHTEVYTLYQLHPFEIVKYPQNGFLLPNYDKRSYFFIGVEQLHFGQTLSLHFEILEGSGNQDLVYPKTTWYVQQNNELSVLNAKEITRDTTKQLFQSGIIHFSLEKHRFETENNVIWLVAACSENETAISDFIAVRAQALTATYLMTESKIIEDILPDTITKPITVINGLKKIMQPYKSFDGRPNESTEDYIVRNSERLRHKGVVINIFDYERIILERFPFLYQVKCIPHSTYSSHQSPGNVLVVLVPKLKKDNSQIELKPRVSVGNRESIKQFLEKLSSPFIQIDVRNPNYKEIQIEVNVKYLPQFDGEKEYYNAVLNRKLQSYISPWIDNASGIEFNKISYKSRYINFIEEEQYVDHITLFNIYIDGIKIENRIESDREDVVFTSASHHIIRNEDLC